MQSILSWDALNTVNKVEVFDKGDLETGGSTLSGGNGRVGKEKFPDLEDVRERLEKRAWRTYTIPAGAVFGFNLLLVCGPVPVPPPDSCAVVH